MKYLIASDIHGSYYYCALVAEAFEKENAGRLLLLGDLLYHGPRNPLPKEYDPARVFGLLNQLKDKISCVRGNCDSEVDQMVLEFPIQADYMLWQARDITVFTTHGHLYNTENPPLIGKKDILLHGHTHVPVAHDTGSFIYLNPGSAALPKENSPNSYMVYQDGVFTIKSFDGAEILRYCV